MCSFNKMTFPSLPRKAWMSLQRWHRHHLKQTFQHQASKKASWKSFDEPSLCKHQEKQKHLVVCKAEAPTWEHRALHTWNMDQKPAAFQEKGGLSGAQISHRKAAFFLSILGLLIKRFPGKLAHVAWKGRSAARKQFPGLNGFLSAWFTF